jgi:hypothetical protein
MTNFVNSHPPKVPLIKEVLWNPPIFYWIECNSDGAGQGSLGNASCGGFIRNSSFESWHPYNHIHIVG